MRSWRNISLASMGALSVKTHNIYFFKNMVTNLNFLRLYICTAQLTDRHIIYRMDLGGDWYTPPLFYPTYHRSSDPSLSAVPCQHAPS